MSEKIRFETMRKGSETNPRQARSAVADKGVVQEIDQILSRAVDAGATDIHFEPRQDGLLVRMRVAGSLEKVKAIDEEMKINVLNRLKVLSGMDFTKTKVPQSGFFKMQVGEKKLELYSYSLPTLYGESVTVKVQYKQSATKRVDQLGMGKAILASYRKALTRTSRLFLITGPPGSGKRTTIYASILEVMQPGMMAMGFDPVLKYEIPGMLQGKLDDHNEFTFAEAVEALLKQEPDVAYIGDILDETEARATIQGAFAKRRVFARVTANDTINAVQNFMDMGIQPFLIAASLAAVLNQRLLRKLCRSCREPYEASEALQKELGYKLPPGAQFYRAKGCSACNDTGYKGVIAIFELFIPSEETNKMIVAKQGVQALHEQALKEGLSTLKADGIRKAMGGYCTLEEVINAL